MMDTALRRHVSAGGRQRHGQPPFTTQARLFAGVVASVVCLLFLFAGILAPLIVLHNMDVEYASRTPRLEYAFATDSGQNLREALIQSIAITRMLEGYVISRLKTLPNMSGTAEERLSGQDFPEFESLSRIVLTGTTSLSHVILAPGGVYKYTYPELRDHVGRDLMADDDCAQYYDPTPQDTIRLATFSYVGPFRSCISVTSGGTWGMSVRRPIFNTTTFEDAQLSNFWGFAVVATNVTDILLHHPIPDANLQRTSGVGDVDVLLSVRQPRPFRVGILSTTLGNLSEDAALAFIASGSSVNVTPNHPFTITVRGTGYGKYMSPMNITIVVACVLFGLLTLLSLSVAALLWCVQGYDAAYHAPKLAPFAMLTIGPCRGEELWDRAPDQMAEVTEQLGQVLARQMVKHHAYQIHQVHPLTTSYVTRGVAAAVQMAHGAIEELQRRPVDDPLRRLLGDDGRLLLTCAVHWCTDAAVRVESLEGSYRYEGPDVVFGGRMWAFAAPGVVTASSAVARELPRFGLRSIDARPHRVVNVLRSRTLSGTTIAGGLSGSGSGSGSGDATIYVPYPVPTTVQATAGICCRGSIASPLRVGGGGDAEDGIDGDAEPLPPQQLFTLLDVRRPALVAAAEAAAAYLADKRCSASTSTGVAVVAVALTDNAAAEDGPVMPVVLSNDDAAVAEGHEEEARVPVQLSSVAFQGDAVTRALLRPVIPRAVDVALHAAFDYQAITLNMRYDAARVLVYYFHFSYKTLFRPLAAPERHNIFRRLVTAFGVPQQGILEHLAARCVIRAVQQNRKAHGAALHRRSCDSTASASASPLTALSESPKNRSLAR